MLVSAALRATRRGGQVGFVAARFASSASRVPEDILQLLGAKASITYDEVASQLNVTTAELDAAITSLEDHRRVYRYRRQGKWDVLVNSPETVVDQVLQKQTPASLRAELDELRVLVAKQRADLASMEEVKSKCDAIARRHPNLFASFGLAGMTGLWCLLFWMVFAQSVFGCETFAFDWNLVEPITYFLGYSVVWFGVVFYYFTGQEYSYDSVRDIMAEKKREKLYAQHSFDMDKFVELQETVSRNERRIEELDELQKYTGATRVTDA